MSSWFLSDGKEVCKKCGYKVIVTQSVDADYFYYCSNKYCYNHNGEQLGDQEECSFIIDKEVYYGEEDSAKETSQDQTRT